MNINAFKQNDLVKSVIIALLALAIAPVTMADEMSEEDKIESAMSAAPTRISRNATILDFDGTVLREGTNKWTCKPGGLPGSKRYPICNDPVFVKWSETVWNGKPFSTDVVGYSYMLAGLSGDPKDDDIFVLFKNTDYEIVMISLGGVITD